MLRIHFQSDDLTRVRVAARIDPMWELVLSLHMLRGNEGGEAFGPWRRHARALLRDCGLRSAVALLDVVNPHTGYFPDFLTPTPLEQGAEAAIDAVLSTSRERLHADLSTLAACRGLPDWVRPLAEGEPAELRRLGDAMRTYCRRVLDPVWDRMQTEVAATHAAHAHAVLDGGLAGLLDSLGSSVRWTPPVLRMDYPEDRDLHLGGRGLLLMPSFFCWRRPVALADPSLRPVLVYPIAHQPATVCSDGRPLAALIGHTRAEVLRSVGAGVTNGQLANRVGIAQSSASEHARVLRESGLIRTDRTAGAVQHRLTALGLTLLGRR